MLGIKGTKRGRGEKTLSQQKTPSRDQLNMQLSLTPNATKGSARAEGTIIALKKWRGTGNKRERKEMVTETVTTAEG